MMVLAPLVVTAQLLLVADRPPTLNVEPSCRAAERSGIEGRTTDNCMRGENQAKATLDDKWTQFSARQQARCTTLVQMGGPPSYVELLTCLEMAEQADKIPDTDTLRGTTGSTVRER
jgi:hypothetical protein